MAISHQLTWSYTAPGLSSNATVTASSESEQNLDVVIAALASDFLVAFTLDYSQCKGFFLLADAAMTIETNDGGSPAQTFTLAAGVPTAWIDGAGTCPVTTDITALYITSTAGGNLTIRSLSDATV